MLSLIPTPVLHLTAAPIVVDASMLSGGANGLLNLVAIAGPNGQILLQQLPAVRSHQGWTRLQIS